MLNNVIYSADLAYVGFMDQSRYDDLSFKQATTKEAIYADMYDSANYTTYFTDYVKSLNNITSVKGRYVEIDSARVSANTPLPYTKTRTSMSIFGKNSKISFLIHTGNSGATPTPSATVTPSATPTATPTTPPIPNYKITLAPSTGYIICDGVQEFHFVVTLTNNGIPSPNTRVRIDKDRIGGSILYGGSPIGAGGIETDLSGQLALTYIDNSSIPGFINITAYLDSDPTIKSNTLRITCAPVCTDKITVTTITPSKSGNDYVVTIKLNMGTFSNEALTMPNGLVYTNADGNAKLTTGINPQYYAATDTIVIKIGLQNKNTAYSAVLTYSFTADCISHSSKYYGKTGTIAYYGDGETLTIDSVTYT
jgi:hypothetical protein